MAAKVLVNCTDTLLTSPRLPLGECQLWKSLAKCLPSVLFTFDANTNSNSSQFHVNFYTILTK